MTEESGSDVSETIKSYLYSRFIAEDIREIFIESQSLEGCACRINYHLSGKEDRRCSDCVNDPIFYPSDFETYDREF